MEEYAKKEVKLENRSKHYFLVATKYIPHLMALCYAIYTFLGFIGIDAFIISCFASMSLLPWIYFIFISYIFKYCYVHRLPLYYILINELITDLDYYLELSLDVYTVLILHILLAAVILFEYSYYYVKFKLKKINKY